MKNLFWRFTLKEEGLLKEKFFGEVAKELFNRDLCFSDQLQNELQPILYDAI